MSNSSVSSPLSDSKPQTMSKEERRQVAQEHLTKLEGMTQEELVELLKKTGHWGIAESMEAEVAYRTAWRSARYTSFNTLRHALKVLTSLGERCQRLLDKDVLSEALEEGNLSDLELICQDGVVLCTSFCIHVASLTAEPTSFQFLELEGTHRAALGMNGIILDSSAGKALRSLDGKAIPGYKGLWKLERSGIEGITLPFKASPLYLQISFYANGY
ncbi:hypothetical protein H103_07763 [Trichophyton rubrum CBS 288.86]|uniref:Uncharacterized protein n=1 Tax=Trichophyton rubrum CBS 288.86 TaxID=1215330 RepID=A0A022VR57_TRIRU|nr:hypothetical protein H103_07763 [Trichophyton rubrum CBS 288.86]EZF59176.1 hypothetical protein H104_07712 [Trichophyton rubrum CBS 289.86]EZF80564.1 hypothetical protein H110_07761 [Trichophyton rubrum MR1448]